MSSPTSELTPESKTAVDRLVECPYEFDFVQAVWVLENVPSTPSADSSKIVTPRVGFDFSPQEEAVRFRVATTLRSVSSQVLSLTKHDEAAIAENGDQRKMAGSSYELTVPFLGLFGPNGVLPRHYTQTIVGRVKQHDYAMRDFLDLFHHRILSMFFRASVKYRLPYVYQATAAEIPARDDSITQVLRCLTGFGDAALKRRMSISDDNFLYYGGHFSDSKPTAHSLERLVSDFCGFPARVKQFQFEWLYIDPSEQTKFDASSRNQLGINMVIGQRVPSWQSRFRVCLGPLHWEDFLTLLPNSPRVARLAELIRTYVGIDLDFDLQVSVHGSEVPAMAMSSTETIPLGWTTWMYSKPLPSIVDDAVFDIGKF